MYSRESAISDKYRSGYTLKYGYYDAQIRVLIKLKEYKHAGAVYHKLFELDGSDAGHYYKAALFLLKYEYQGGGDDRKEILEKAKIYIEAAIEKDPNNRIHYAQYAKICRMLDQDEVIINAYVQKALNLEDHYDVLHVTACDM